MKPGYRLAVASLAVVIALPVLSVAASATTEGLDRARAEQSAIDDITTAQAALAHRRMRVALTTTGNAETDLLNARSAGILPDHETRTINELALADSDEQYDNGPAAAAALNSAIAHLQ